MALIKDYGAMPKVVKYNVNPTAAAAAAATETNTDIYLPAKAIVLDVWIEVNTVDATETVDVGTTLVSNDPDGYLDGVSLATAGIVRGKATITAGSNETYFASSTRGALLATLVAGTDNATDVGTYYEFPDLTSPLDRISFTTSAGTDTADFDICVMYIEP